MLLLFPYAQAQAMPAISHNSPCSKLPLTSKFVGRLQQALSVLQKCPMQTSRPFLQQPGRIHAMYQHGQGHLAIVIGTQQFTFMVRAIPLHWSGATNYAFALKSSTLLLNSNKTQMLRLKWCFL